MEKRMPFWKTAMHRTVCAGLAAVLLLYGACMAEDFYIKES